MSQATSFQPILERAQRRKGGENALNKLLSKPKSNAFLAKQDDAYYLAHMTRCVFNAGFVWKIVTQKWPHFEQVFLGFDPMKLLRLSDEQWEAFASNKDIIRHYTKIKSVRDNAQFLLDVHYEHGSFGKLISEWPSSEQADLLKFLKQKATRLGGMSGQYFLRRCGKDGFILSQDVVMCLQDCGLDIKSMPTSQREMKLIQSQFNDWHEETQLPYQQLSQIAGFSIGQNYV